MPLAVYFLAVAVFAMGTSEFMLAGLLPDLAADIHVDLGAAGLLTSAFAVGMVVGAPLTAALARTWPQRSSLLAFIAVFAAAHVLGAVTDDFAALLATRVIAAVANAGFLALALTAAAGLVAPDRKGRALAVLLSGTTVATVVGVPGGALLSALLDWRATFWAVALLCLPAALGILRGVPARVEASETPAAPALAAELAQLRRPRLLLVMFLGALVNAATFGVLTYLHPIVTDVAGLEELWVPVALVLFGIGSYAGVTAAGRLSDHRPGPVIAVAGPLLLAGWAAMGASAANPVALLALVFVQGVLAFAVGSTLIARVLYEGAGAPTLAGAYATAALNVGAAAGPLAAAAALGTGSGGTGPVWAGAVLMAAALLTAVPFRRVFAAGRTAAMSRD
ncbi:Cmx/CmrA family chloramphenicol efflux MFS transporter [Glycomyces albidus]|uniref:Cmx/CmrA family chloramphenicol efflux MFS transporter n=1 Tax=Glycomyces albidus TaxID=2656774 RepID=A0A6L5G4X2_9ACTN|nr:Cmx/CmrA family chloramphenicol efflux MFS transporter [Glycomyces albidus]MQM24689.1 Cmx/CmrA family chloramphenicol efflux MFS transporter [Glycomyces albidus]